MAGVCAAYFAVRYLVIRVGNASGFWDLILEEAGFLPAKENFNATRGIWHYSMEAFIRMDR